VLGAGLHVELLPCGGLGVAGLAERLVRGLEGLRKAPISRFDFGAPTLASFAFVAAQIEFACAR
jgi:hypothetical protein